MQNEFLAQRVRLARCCECRKQSSYVLLSDAVVYGEFQSTRVHCIACDKFTVFRCCTEAASRRRRGWTDPDLVETP